MILTLFCVISGSFPASLGCVNSKIFDLNLFDMGLPRFERNEIIVTLYQALWIIVKIIELGYVFSIDFEFGAVSKSEKLMNIVWWICCAIVISCWICYA